MIVICRFSYNVIPRPTPAFKKADPDSRSSCSSANACWLFTSFNIEYRTFEVFHKFKIKIKNIFFILFTCKYFV